MTGLDYIKRDFQDKKILVLGLGILGGGEGAARFFAEIGSQVTVSDKKSAQELKQTLDNLKNFPIDYRLKNNNISPINFDAIIKNPAIPDCHPTIIEANKHKIPIYTEAALFVKYSSSTVVGITGTRGKTTTTLLTYKILKSAFGHVNLGGNIPGKSTIELLKNEAKYTVLELSSWQLNGFHNLKISPHIAVFTNLFPDHLDRYISMDRYAYDKTAIFAYQTKKDILIIPENNSLVASLVLKSESSIKYFDKSNIESYSLHLLGSHNRDNAAAAMRTAQSLNINEPLIKKVIENFKSVSSRLEVVKVVNKVTFINDSTSTTPSALLAAINAMESKFYLIMGGNSKKLPTDDLIKHLNTNKFLKEIYLLPGSGSQEIKSKLTNYTKIENLGIAVEEAFSRTKAGEIILFSPGFTSFHQFKNEFDRAETFNRLVRSL